MTPMITLKPITAPMNKLPNAPNAPAELPNKNGVSANKYFIYSPLCLYLYIKMMMMVNIMTIAKLISKSDAGQLLK